MRPRSATTPGPLLVGGGDASAATIRGLVLLGVLIPWVLNLAKASLIARTEGYVVAIKMTILLVVVVAGVPSVESARLSTSEWASPVSIIAAGMLVFVAYEGFELISNASADLRNPKRNLPRAFGLSIGIVIVVYVAISAVVVGSLDPSEIAASADYALAEAANASLGSAGFTLVIFLAVFAAVNVAAFRGGADADVVKPLALAGAALCVVSLGVLTVVNVRDDPTSLVVLAVLFAAGLFVEHLVLRPRRLVPISPS